MSVIASESSFDRPPDSAARRISRAGWIVMLILPALAAVICLAAPIGWLGSDDASYYSAAEHVVAGAPIQRVHHHYARSPVILPVALSIFLLGASPFTLYLPALLAVTASIGMVIAIGNRLWGLRAGVLAGVLLVSLPALQNNATCLLPNAFTLFFAALAILLALRACDSATLSRMILLSFVAGVSAGAATSTKLFAGAVMIALAGILWSTAKQRADNAERRAAILAAAIGCVTFFVVEGCFYSVFANDFWYKLNAISSSRQEHSVLARNAGYTSLGGSIRLILNRLALPFRATDTGWGFVGMAFWPTMAIAMWHRKSRPLAAWALLTFVAVGFVPIGYRNGWRVSPRMMFTGHNLFVLSLPLCLCTAMMIDRLLTRWCPPRRIGTAAVVAALAIMSLGVVERVRFNRQGEFLQKEVGRAIASLVEADPFDDRGIIYTLPSIYWRYRILFPRQLRHRLRVVAAADCPQWWRHASFDMESRHRPLPDPPYGYLLAAVEHLEGKTLYWDYGVGLPADELRNWQLLHPCFTAGKDENGAIASAVGPGKSFRPLLHVLDGSSDDRHADRNLPAGEVHSQPPFRSFKSGSRE